LPPAKAARTGENSILVLPALVNKSEEAHNRPMKIVERIRAWRRRRTKPPTDVDTTDDWTTVGKTFRATDAVFDKTLPNRSDEGRPPH
jgi:hypothetical protein